MKLLLLLLSVIELFSLALSFQSQTQSTLELQEVINPSFIQVLSEEYSPMKYQSVPVFSSNNTLSIDKPPYQCSCEHCCLHHNPNQCGSESQCFNIKKTKTLFKALYSIIIIFFITIIIYKITTSNPEPNQNDDDKIDDSTLNTLLSHFKTTQAQKKKCKP